MGNSTSAPPRTLTRKEADLQYLAERTLLGDKELTHLYNVYHTILRKPSEQRFKSFLVEWSTECSSPETRNERKTLLEVVESQFLPENWGLRLYRTAFCRNAGDDAFGYSENHQSRMEATAVTDEFTRKSRLEAFCEGLSNAGRRGSKQSLSVLFNSCRGDSESQQDGRNQYCKAVDLAMLAFKLALVTAFLKAANAPEEDAVDMSDYIPSLQDDLAHVNLLAESMLQRAQDRRNNQQYAIPAHPSASDESAVPPECISMDELAHWCDTTAPVFASILPTFIHHVFFPNQPFPPTRTAFDFPRLCANQDSSFFPSPRSPQLFVMACLSPSLNGSFFRLYASDQDGLSFNRLQNALVGYSGPTLLLIRSVPSGSNGGVFGAFTASPWKESKDFYGQSDCFLYQLHPRTAVYRPRDRSNGHFMYCNPQARSKGYDQQAHGLGFGGTVSLPRLFVAENFDDNVAATADLTFENGPLLPPVSDSVGTQKTQFAIDSLEVWGVGGDEVVQQALGARDRVRAMKDEGIRRARKVDKAQFLDDFRSGVIASKAFAYKDQIDGRADQDVEDRIRERKEGLG